MAKRLGDLADVRVVTTLTCVFCIAIACARSRHSLCLAVVTQSIHKGILIAVAADGAGMGGVAHMGAVRLRDLILIGVLLLGDGLRVGLATGAGEGHDAFLGAGRFLRHLLGILVAQGIGVVSHVAVVTSGAGIGGVAHLIMGRCRHLLLVVVPQGFYDAVHIAVLAPGAGMERVTGSLAGGSYHLLGVRMAQLQDQLGFLFMADRAFPLLDTVAGAGGFLQGLPLAPRMGAGCGNGPSLLLTAQSAGPGLLTGLGASGSLGHSPFAPLMAGGRNRPLFHLTAVEAGPGLLPRFGAGCSLNHLPLAPVVAAHLHNRPGFQSIALSTGDIAAFLHHHHGGSAFGNGLEG